MNRILFCAAMLIFLSGCQATQTEVSINTNTTEPKNSSLAEKSTEDNEAPNTEKTVKEFSLDVAQWSYSPERIEVNEGDTVIITAQSLDVPHSFTLPDFNDESRDNGTGGISVLLQKGQKEVITFVADKKGEFTYGCDVVCGSGHTTMKGVVVVR